VNDEKVQYQIFVEYEHKNTVFTVDPQMRLSVIRNWVSSRFHVPYKCVQFELNNHLVDLLKHDPTCEELHMVAENVLHLKLYLHR